MREAFKKSAAAYKGLMHPLIRRFIIRHEPRHDWRVHAKSTAATTPINILAGYLISTIIAVLAMQVVPEPWWLAALAVGFTMLIMLVLRVTHPPAVAVPLLIYSGPVDAATLFVVLLASCAMLIAFGMLLHRLPPKIRYPLPLVEEIEKE